MMGITERIGNRARIQLDITKSQIQSCPITKVRSITTNMTNKKLTTNISQLLNLIASISKQIVITAPTNHSDKEAGLNIDL